MRSRAILAERARAMKIKRTLSPSLCFFVVITGALLGGALEAQPGGPDLDAALGHLERNAAALGLTQDDLADKIVTDQYPSARSGITHIYFKQRLQGIEVANGTINVNVDRQGVVLNVGNRFVGRLTAKANRRCTSAPRPS